MMNERYDEGKCSIVKSKKDENIFVIYRLSMLQSVTRMPFSMYTPGI